MTTVVPGSDAVEEAVDELVGHDVSLHHRAMECRLKCVNSTPLGRPVVPEV